MFVLDVSLEVYLLSEVDAADAAGEALHVLVYQLVSLQVAAGRRAVRTLAALVLPPACATPHVPLTLAAHCIL